MTQQSGHSLERKKEQADTELSASAGSAVQRASSDAAAILFFLRKEKEKNGGANVLLLEKQKENSVRFSFSEREAELASKKAL